MHDARDAEDTRLFETGESSRLLESYGVVIDRCRLDDPQGYRARHIGIHPPRVSLSDV